MQIVKLLNQNCFEILDAFELDAAIEGKPEIEKKIHENRLIVKEIVNEGLASQPKFNAFNDIGSACWVLEQIRNGYELDLMLLN